MIAKPQKSLLIYGWLSISAAILTILLKSYAYWLTDSVSLLSDALESLINLAAAIIVLIALSIAAKPPDDSHPYGHEKIEYFSSGAEGIMILLAAFSIAVTAWERLWHPQSLQQLDVGVMIAAIASLINLIVARVLMSAGKRHQSITLEADGRHLMTDVWTTVGIILGIGIITAAKHFEFMQEVAVRLGIKSWEILDPIIAILVAMNIIWSGLQLIRRTFSGLMDETLPIEDRTEILAILDAFVLSDGIAFHAFRTRYAGSRKFMAVHVLVPGNWTVQRGHDLLEKIESEIMAKLGNIDIDTHLEPIEDLVSWKHREHAEE